MPPRSPRETCRWAFPRLTWSEPETPPYGEPFTTLTGTCKAFSLKVYIAIGCVDVDVVGVRIPSTSRTTLGRALYAARLAIRKQAKEMLAFSEV